MTFYSDYTKRPVLSRLPPWLSRWFGYRATPPNKPPKYIAWLWSWIGAFCGLSVIMAVLGQAQYFINKKVPMLVASYGASAVLIYGSLDAPLAQPRPLVVGHFISALIGVCISKLFQLSPHFENLRWLSASISCATSIVVMQITETTHPPAGASALLPSIDTELQELGWYYLPVILLSSFLALAVALFLNNIQRSYPLYWIVPHQHADKSKDSSSRASPGVSSSIADLSSGVSTQSRVGEAEKNKVQSGQIA